MKTKPSPNRHGSLLTISDRSRDKPLGVVCCFCGDEVYFSLTSFHRGHNRIRCRGCAHEGYMIRRGSGGSLRWFSETMELIED